MKEEVEDTEEGMQYGIFKGDGKPKGAMAAFGKKKKKLRIKSLSIQNQVRQSKNSVVNSLMCKR